MKDVVEYLSDRSVAIGVLARSNVDSSGYPAFMACADDRIRRKAVYPQITQIYTEKALSHGVKTKKDFDLSAAICDSCGQKY